MAEPPYDVGRLMTKGGPVAVQAELRLVTVVGPWRSMTVTIQRRGMARPSLMATLWIYQSSAHVRAVYFVAPVESW
jgi:hypothetical protein